MSFERGHPMSSRGFVINWSANLSSPLRVWYPRENLEGACFVNTKLEFRELRGVLFSISRDMETSEIGYDEWENASERGEARSVKLSVVMEDEAYPVFAICKLAVSRVPRGVHE